MADETKRPAQDGAQSWECAVIESAVLRLHRGIPLTLSGAEAAEYDAQYRDELIKALLFALDVMAQAGLSAEETPMLAEVRCAYES